MFVTIDGIDGAGKTTLATALAAWLFGKYGLNVLLTKEPTTRSPWAKKLRAAALSVRMPKAEELEFFHKDRLWHLKQVIHPALKQQQVVICDRYVDSTLAYQAATPQEADALFDRMEREIAIPELTFILDCPVEICLDRIDKRNQPITSFESRDTLERARKIFASRVGSHYRILDSTKPPEELLIAAKNNILPFVGGSNHPTKRRVAPKPIDPNSSKFGLVLPTLALSTS